MSVTAINAMQNNYSSNMKRVGFGEDVEKKEDSVDEKPKMKEALAADKLEKSKDTEDKKEIKKTKKKEDDDDDDKDEGGHWGLAIGSLLITGLGQLIDGRTKDALTQFGIALGCGAVGFIGRSMKAPVLSGLASIAALGVGIYSAVDAYKGGIKKK